MLRLIAPKKLFRLIEENRCLGKGIDLESIWPSASDHRYIDLITTALGVTNESMNSKKILQIIRAHYKILYIEQEKRI